MMKSWTSAQESAVNNDFASAITSLRSIPNAVNNVRILRELGRWYHLLGDRGKAITALLKAHALEPSSLLYMDTLAALLAQERRVKELESLAVKLIEEDDQSVEAWIACGYFSRCQAKTSRALYFAHKACTVKAEMHPKCEALLLKAVVLIDLKKFTEANCHLNDALMVESNSIDVYEALIRCALQEDNRLPEAKAHLNGCREVLGVNNGRVLFLSGMVMARDGKTLDEAFGLLEKAVAEAPFLLDAVFLLVELYEKSHRLDKAIQLLTRLTEQNVDPRLHRLLGDCLSRTESRPTVLTDHHCLTPETSSSTVPCPPAPSRRPQAPVHSDFSF